MTKTQYSVSVGLMILLSSACNVCEYYGAYNLGGRLTLLEGDRQEDRIIVYCTSKVDECCSSGIYVIPSDVNHIKDGKYYSYVEALDYNNDYIGVRSIQIEDSTLSYWIIDKDLELELETCENLDCDSIIQTFVTGPLELKAFNNLISKLNTSLILK